jgi:sugar phosphate isomerase/epimerase
MAAETFRKLKALGYDEAQTAGCYGMDYAEFYRLANEAGIEIVGTHDDFQQMKDDIETAIANHKMLGTTNMGIGGFGAETVESVEQFIEAANKIAARIAAEGMKFTYHNHSQEFIVLENGKTPMEMLIEGLDPAITSFVLDTYWVQNAGGDVCSWIEKLAGRIDILHLKDMGRNQNGPFITEVGNGNIWWEGVLETAAQAGIKHYVVEQDSWPGDPFDSVKMAADYLKKFM